MSSNNDYRRGQIFGFTMAEIMLLLLFCLLLILTHKILNEEKKIDDYEFDRTRLERVLVSLEKDKNSFYVVLKDFKDQIKREEKTLAEDSLQYQELRKIMVLLGRDYASSKSENERLKVVKEKLLKSSLLEEAGVSSNRDPAELSAALKLFDKIKNANDSVESQLVKSESDNAKKDKELAQSINQNKFLQKELEKFTGKGQGLPPCWTDKDGVPKYLYSIAIFDDSLKVSKIYAESDLTSIPHAEVVRSISFENGATMSPEIFLKTFDPLKSKSLKSGMSCEYWVKVCDNVSETHKSLYKQRMGEIWRSFHPRSQC
jgi:type II secretory pathway component PulJ